jgi:hypothetical protein
MNHSPFKKIIGLWLSLVLALPAAALTTLSDKAQVSLLTCAPSDEAVFTVYGHTAIRIADPAVNMDLIFNYGIFDFNTSDFIYRFTKGETDYKLGINYFDNLLAEYEIRRGGIVEQVLNLTEQEKNAIWEALQINALPENATYRYNFFFDNCATRSAQLIERCVAGEVAYHHEPTRKTFRELINYYMRNQPWLVFGCQMALGSPADRIATRHEELFLPLLLEKAFDQATILSPDGKERPLVSATNILLDDHPEAVRKTILTPWTVALICMVATLALTLAEWKKKKYYFAMDCLLFTLAGASGSVLFFLAFVSEHAATWPNWILL